MRAVKELENMFRAADRDGSGKISTREFACILRHYGVYDNPRQARLALSSLRSRAGRADAEKCMDFDEFCEFLLKYEDVRVADMFPGNDFVNFLWLPGSLQLDVACRAGYLPVSALVVVVALELQHMHGGG